ncbi:HNH endonuclease signature motif containing protein [Caballeronia sp. NCTM5]|uniref:HNH endonuclease n=1 Tax=Caballeronia sp. NCTM5 TaxID=2921755 RepID=UPI002028DB3E|nr:HNH endonuclease signature motif containing protein [Caballeronia sp. NCTM5]
MQAERFTVKQDYDDWNRRKGDTAYVFVPYAGNYAASCIHYSGCAYANWRNKQSERFCADSLEVLLSDKRVRGFLPKAGGIKVCLACERIRNGLRERATQLLFKPLVLPIDEFRRQLEQEGIPSGKEGETERWSLVRRRVGQDILRKRLLAIRGRCEVTGLETPALLVASHIQPWNRSNDEERLSIENTFLLAANIDALFDKNLISFSDDGLMVFSLGISDASLQCLGVSRKGGHRISRTISDVQKQFLLAHRNDCLMAKV